MKIGAINQTVSFKSKSIPVAEGLDVFRTLYQKKVFNQGDFFQLLKYKDDKNYKLINTALRERIGISPFKSIVDAIDRIFVASRAPEDMVLKRNIKRFCNMERIFGKEKFFEPAYTSTTINDTVANLFGNFKIRINVPKGAPVIDMGAALNKLGKTGDFEAEYLLPRNSFFQVTKFDKDAGEMILDLISKK